MKMNEELVNTNIKLLVVEDRPAVTTEIREWLVKIYGYSDFDAALNMTEAKQYLKSNHYDVIIADMYLGEETKTGGFLILEEIEQQGITSIVIIFTANENYPDCRHAFQNGAFDYISKNIKGNAFEELHHAIQRALTYINRWGNRHNEEWIQNNHEYLNVNYNNQYVAVLNNGVIESAATQDDLKQRIKDKSLPLSLATIRKITVKLLHDLPIEQLLKTKDEGHHLEFKSSLLYNLHTQQKDEAKVLHAVLKTIVAFLNAEGGTLVIGVQDNKGICGITNDLPLIPKKHDEDGFELHLRSYIEGRIGKDFCVQNITIRFESIENKRVCIVDVTRSSKRAFLEGKEFFVRNGNRTDSYTISQFYDYMQSAIS
jgi:response regulator of citrate/malate metabolism